jgi:hypothetical protein
MKKNLFILDVLIIAFVFVLGILISNILNPNLDQPFGYSNEIQSPNDWITDSDIKVYQDKVIINVENTRYVGIANTNSMDPFIDENTNVLEILPENLNDIQVGDIISFEIETGDVYIHRVVNKGYDEQGLYFITKGDNNPSVDPIVVYPDQILGVVAIVIY